MAYIELEELKEILPGILDQWIDKEDESWEWIFQEIEQKCHVGKKKTKNKKLASMIDTHSTVLAAHRNDINELNKKFEYYEDALKKVKEDIAFLIARMRTISSEAKEAKFAAQTAKQRTEVDYSKYSSKSDGEKMCKTCKYYVGDPNHLLLSKFDAPPCNSCNHNDNWEAKDE